MKVYDVYYNTSVPRLIRKGLTEEQVDTMWKELKAWEKCVIDVMEREIEEPEEER